MVSYNVVLALICYLDRKNSIIDIHNVLWNIANDEHECNGEKHQGHVSFLQLISSNCLKQL